MDRRYLIFSLSLLSLGAVWIFASALPSGSRSLGGIPAPQRGFFAPDFTLTGNDGNSYTLSELRGQPILVNFWASWCTPCKAEMPAMERVYQEFRQDGFLVLAINTTHQDSRDSAREFTQRLGLTFPILFDTNGAVASSYQMRALPTSFFIRPDGRIEEVVIGGPMSEALLRTRVARIIEAQR